MSNLNIIFIANELDNNNLNGPNVVFFNIIKTICLNEDKFDKKFKFYFLLPNNLNFNYLRNQFKNINFINLKVNNKFGLFFTMLILKKFLKKLGNNYVFFYPKLSYFPFFENQLAFLYDLPLEKRFLIDEIELKKNIQKQFLFKRKIINSLKFIFTISKSAKEDIIRFLEIEKVGYVYLGVDNEIFKPLNIKDLNIQKYDLKYKGYFFYPAGKLWFRKNIINLLLAFYKLISYSENYKDIQLVITANNYNDLKDKYVLEVRKVIKDYKLNNNVKIFYVDNEDMVSLYNGAIAVIFSSFYEGFGLPILETLACKIPILFSNIPVFNEIFNENIFKFDPNNVDSIYLKLKEFLEFYLKKDNQELNRIIELGYKKVFNFTWLSSVKNLLSKIESIIDKE